jgi:hypothetical protein
MDEYECPICGRSGEVSLRYPHYICVECAHRAVDENGQRLKFSNVALSGGFEARYVDGDEIRDSHVCYVDGVRCLADEAHMGGIVVIIDNNERE